MAERHDLTGQPNLMKEINKGLIKNALYQLKIATRVEICEKTKISQPTVNAIINELVENNVVIEKGYAQSSGGRKAVMYSLNGELACIVAIVADTNFLEYEITDLDHTVIDKNEMEINTEYSYLDNIIYLISKLTEENEKIRAVAIGVPGAVSSSGKVFAIPQIPELEECELKARIEDRFKMKVIVKNDINVIALGYYRKVLAIKARDMAFLHVGEGLGASIIIKGEIVSGFSSFAGEVGYMQIKNSGNAEEDIFTSNSIEEQGKMIAKVIINMICLINPAVLVLGGNLVNEQLQDIVIESCHKKLPEDVVPACYIIKNEKKYYFNGLQQLAIDVLNLNVRLVRQSEGE